MSAKILRLPLRSPADWNGRWVEVVGYDGAAGKLANKRHVPRPRTTATGFPVVPNLPHCTDGRGRSIKRQTFFKSPLAQRVCKLGNHSSLRKLISYCLTSVSKGISGSFVSADILQFGRMENAPNRIRSLRLAASMSQQALGDVVGVSKMTISDLERGKMELTLDYMRRVAKALAVKPADLLPDEDNPDRLSDAERALIADFRDAAEPQQELIRRVAEPVNVERRRDAA